MQPEAELFILWTERAITLDLLSMPNDEAEYLLAMRAQYGHPTHQTEV